MKKIIIVLLTLVMLFITGCSKAPSPSSEVEKMIEEIKTAPIEKFGEGLFSDDANELEKEVFNQFMAMLQKQSYTLGDEKVDGDKATVDVHFKTFDFGTSFEKTITNYFNEVMAMALSEASEASEEDYENLMYKMWKEDLIELEKEGLTKEGTFTFELVKKDKTWELTNDESEELADIYFGGLFSSLSGVTGE